MSHLNWESMLAPLPFVAILRGLQSENVEKIVGQLCESGFRAVEIPFNSPDPLKSVELAAHKFGGDILIGGGTVLDAGNVERIHDVGIKHKVINSSSNQIYYVEKLCRFNLI
jgi:2-dehydro-3-deoxyphosphogalactonate aldolase